MGICSCFSGTSFIIDTDTVISGISQIDFDQLRYVLLIFHNKNIYHFVVHVYPNPFLVKVRRTRVPFPQHQPGRVCHL